MRNVLASAVVFLGVALARPAEAMLMQSYDLASLAFEAEEVVLVEVVSTTKIEGELRDFARVRVERSFAGSALHPGDELTVETSCYNPAPIHGWGERRPKPAVSSERVLFLRRVVKNRWATAHDSGAPPTEWGLAASGMRMFVDGRVYRFVQQMNPGCYGPAPEGPRDAPYTREAFEGVLERVVATAKNAHVLLAAPASPERTEKLLAILAAAQGDGEIGTDEVGGKILEAFADEADLPALLEGIARAPRVDLFSSHLDVPIARLVAAAKGPAPLRQRVAAMRLLNRGSSAMSSDDASFRRALPSLLSDPAPEIRLAALDAGYPVDGVPKAYSDALVAQFRVEKDPRVRHALFARAKRDVMAGRLELVPGELPLAIGVQEHGTVHIAWDVLDGDAGNAEDITIVLRRDGAVVARFPGETRGISGSRDEKISYLDEITAPPGIAPGLYEVQIELVIRAAKDGPKRPDAPRTLDLGPMTLAPPRAAPPPASPEPVVDAPPPEPSRWRMMALRPGPRILAGAVVGLVLGLLAVQRRRRRAAPSHLHGGGP